MRRWRAATIAGGFITGALLLAACSQQAALSLARQACAHVGTSITLYTDAQKATDAAIKARELHKANRELQAAEPLAAAATSSNGQWNALMTTLSEIDRVDEEHLIPALKAQCAVANSKQSQLPASPTTLPPIPGTKKKAHGGVPSPTVGHGTARSTGP